MSLSGAPSVTPQNTWVLVCTYRRTQLLTQLLGSLAQTAPPEGSTLQCPQLVVVDNAPEPEARQTVLQHYPQAVYVHEPAPGIASARNAALDAVPAQAEAVVFLDDDEQVSEQWFSALLEAANGSGADAVTGPVMPVFANGEPDWVAGYGYVRRTRRPEGPMAQRPATNNTLVRAEWFAPAVQGGRALRFDEAFNFTGGEDSDLFERMADSGARFWWAPQVVVAEHVPADRASRQWLRTRAVRGGQVRALKLRRRSSAVVPLRLAAEGTGRMAYGALRRTGRRLRRQTITYTDDYYLCEGLGMLQSLTGGGRAEYAR